MLKIAIVEDQPTAAAHLRDFLAVFAREEGQSLDVTVYEDAVRFLDHYKPMYDMVFMDIELPELDGMSAAQKLRKLDERIVLIFVTNMAQYAVRGYEVDALEYIVKPLQYPDFKRKMTRAVQMCRKDTDFVMLMQQSGMKRLLLRDIRYIEVRSHSLMYHTESGVYTGSGTLMQTQEKLEGKGFLRCNKCYLVNYKHIEAVDGFTLRLCGGEELIISRPRKKAFMNELAQSLGNENML